MASITAHQFLVDCWLSVAGVQFYWTFHPASKNPQCVSGSATKPVPGIFVCFSASDRQQKFERRNKNLSRLDISIEKKRNKSHRRATSSPNKGRSTWFKVRMNFVFPLILELKKKERKTNGHLDGCRLFFREWLHSLSDWPWPSHDLYLKTDGCGCLRMWLFSGRFFLSIVFLSTCLTTFRHPFQSSPSWCDNFNQCRHPLRKNSVFFFI